MGSLVSDSTVLWLKVIALMVRLLIRPTTLTAGITSTRVAATGVT
jgi:hypothetical protein